MDHFLPIRDPAYETPKVLLLYNEIFSHMFDDKGMEGFPARAGWDLGALYLRGEWKQGRTKSIEEFASFLQAWPFIGFHEVLSTWCRSLLY
jgi:hypothetical protein